MQLRPSLKENMWETLLAAKMHKVACYVWYSAFILCLKNNNNKAMFFLTGAKFKLQTHIVGKKYILFFPNNVFANLFIYFLPNVIQFQLDFDAFKSTFQVWKSKHSQQNWDNLPPGQSVLLWRNFHTSTTGHTPLRGVQVPKQLSSYLGLTWPRPADRGAQGWEHSGSILVKTVPSPWLCWSASPSGPGAPAAGLEHLWRARGTRKDVSVSSRRRGVEVLVRVQVWREEGGDERSAVHAQLRASGMITERARGSVSKEREE